MFMIDGPLERAMYDGLGITAGTSASSRWFARPSARNPLWRERVCVGEWQILEASIAGRDVARESSVVLKEEEVEEQNRTRNEAPLSLTHGLIL